MRSYDPNSFEERWQEEWEAQQLYAADDDSEKERAYVLDMFPYPSGSGLHVGHVEGYTATDIYARFQRMNGKAVLHPMGWDAFGLPAENYAIKTDVHPRKTTQEAIQNFTEQIKRLGLSYDWGREINTSSPGYYAWTQWLFVQLFNHGLAERNKADVNWCPSCQTVLANEQVEDGACGRCGSEVTTKSLLQWFFTITDYADELIDDLETVNWPESTKRAQENWIGKSEGAHIDFEIDSSQRFVILHGFQAGPGDYFYPQLKDELEKRGHEVVMPELPDTDDPDVMEQVAYVKEEVNFDENTVLVGHSLGAVVAMKVVEELDQPLSRLVLIAPFIDAEFADGDPRSYSNNFDYEFDFEAIKGNARTIDVVQPSEDNAVTDGQTSRVRQAVGGSHEVVAVSKPHAKGADEPEVVRTVLPHVRTFTTRPDTLMGATYLVLSPEHQIISNLQFSISNEEEVEKYIEEAKNKTEIERTAADREKTGVRLEGIEAVHPITGEQIPIFVADYVLAEYGTGAIMAVPAHDERDFAFAQKYNIPIITVVDSGQVQEDGVYTGAGELINSGDFNGLSSEEAKKEIATYLESIHRGSAATTYRLRDWSIGRQRYWGAPIPIVYDPEGRPHAIPEEHLPWELPDDVTFTPEGYSPLADSDELKKRTEEIFGEGWTPEVDTMDTFVDSSWYFFRFADPYNEDEFAEKKKIEQWLPVDLYMGGAEHTVLHLLYARFITKVLNDLGHIDFREPFSTLRHQGMILAEDGRKMSKSLGNVVNPNDVIERFGADAIRLFEMFLGPIADAKPWKEDGLVGVRRFLEKVWRIADLIEDDAESGILETKLHQTIKKVTEDTPVLKFNTAIAAMMEFANAAEKEGAIPAPLYDTFLTLLAPYAPHITEELWRNERGYDDSIHTEGWPAYDEEKTREETMTIAVQVDGHLRGEIEVPHDASEEEIKKKARTEESVAKWLEDSPVKREIYVSGRLVNFVIGNE